MDLNAGRAFVTEGSSSLHQDALWQRNLRSREQMEPGPYPVREGEPDCSYYIRTGLCRFGETCRFNHPPNRELSYLNSGISKLGATYKSHHPREDAAIAGSVPLNVLGYPLRPNMAECAYYLRTGQCKFGSTCKFHHPHPSNMTINLQSSPVYTSFHSPPSPGQLPYRTSFAGSSSYAPPLLPQGIVSVPGWNTYSGQLDSVSPSESNQQTTGNNQVQGTSYPYEAANFRSQGTYSLYLSGSLSSGYLMQKENVFPERPGQPECQFYMKTGDCKFGAVCKFHHPRERLIPAPDCALNPLGLPLRQGEPLCSFYLRYGICKFGSSCKFDHPMEVFTSNLSASSTDALVHGPLLGSSPGTCAPTFLSDDLVESGSTKLRRLSLTEVRSVSSDDNEIDAEG